MAHRNALTLNFVNQLNVLGPDLDGSVETPAQYLPCVALTVSDYLEQTKVSVTIHILYTCRKHIIHTIIHK